MWVFTFLCMVGLNVFPVTGGAKSTQMYYFKLKIEKSVIGNLTKILNTFGNTSNLEIEDLLKTTTCQSFSEYTECTCEPGHRWSDKVCQSSETCCDNDKCTFPKTSPHVCISDTSVAIKGSLKMRGTQYQDCFADGSSPEFRKCNSKLSYEMKKVYSTLRGFDTLKMTKYSVRSIMADFELTSAYYMKHTDLLDKTKYLIATLSASMLLETTGMVHIGMPENPVEYNARLMLMCTTKDDLGTVPVWQLKKANQTFTITNGTVSSLTTSVQKAFLKLRNIDEAWFGEYTCAFNVKSESMTILHRASAVLNVSLLPNIDITTVPAFPRCLHSEDLLSVRGKCEIRRSYENYRVTWTSQNVKAKIISKLPYYSKKTVVYVAETMVGCNSHSAKPQLTCTFQNRRNQTRSASVDIDIIYADETFCETEGEWSETKSGYTAVIKCYRKHGHRQRLCNGTASVRWEQEESRCVNSKVNDMSHIANMIDLGIGTVDENSADVLYRLESITSKTETIAKFEDLNVSVDVLRVLSEKLTEFNNESAVSDFLASSSNFLEKPLDNVWKTTKSDKGNLTLGETYLSSVEKLIEMANITGSQKKPNVEVSTCYREQGSKCTNTAFDTTVNFDSSDPCNVKTAGFQQLGTYLPNHDDNYTLNSIVVSTTTEKNHSGSVQVEIDFQLLNVRPRNFKIKCVSWNFTSRQWSEAGCEWLGASREGSCVCSHLSSFAILMSREPLEIPGMKEITTAGLSLSVVSLVICIAVELTTWGLVVKTNTSYLRHTAHINISLCLLVADCCFLASMEPKNISQAWCKAFVVLKHFFYLSLFFWTLCLSSTLIHQAVFLFHNLSKKVYQRFSFLLGYVCPFLIVTITFLTNDVGATDVYFSRETCWLVYRGPFRGSIHTFILPVGIISCVNVFAMLVIIMKLLSHPKNTQVFNPEKAAAKTVIRSVIILTPIFGVTWMVGFGVIILDLSSGLLAYVVNYVFLLLNTFQGLLILLTTCLGDKRTREALMQRFMKRAPAPNSESSTNVQTRL